jgi:hypothetical protein
MDIDREAILRTFLAESEEHLGAMEEALVALEAQPEDEGLLQLIFRVVHTLKGSSFRPRKCLRPRHLSLVGAPPLPPKGWSSSPRRARAPRPLDLDEDEASRGGQVCRARGGLIRWGLASGPWVVLSFRRRIATSGRSPARRPLDWSARFSASPRLKTYHRRRPNVKLSSTQLRPELGIFSQLPSVTPIKSHVSQELLKGVAPWEGLGTPIALPIGALCAMHEWAKG